MTTRSAGESLSRNTDSVSSRVSRCGGIPYCAEDLADDVGEPGRLQLHDGHVDGQARARGEDPRGVGAGDGAAQDVLAEGDDEVGLLGDGDELDGGDAPELRVVPAGEGLELLDAAGREVHDRLVVDVDAPLARRRG